MQPHPQPQPPGDGSPGVEAKGKGKGKATGERKKSRRKVQQTPPQADAQADAPAIADDGAEGATERPARKKKKSAHEVKRLKMDLVGHWLENAAAAASSSSSSSTSSSLAVADDQELRQWVEAYRARQARRRAGAHLPAIGKMDDLADCLVQAVTWLEWQQMRHRLMAEPSLVLKL
ncbi:hypothetical protein BP00DRAFT_422808 [Aspergillus indologenus CBS 114.80]|uniref:Mitochondrial resolvase Ydc2 catalytic domain-containing protein n=1 Tax=Aspergillus indologenus CBS 114.80 TaxID=1450541 RepID=A0A2V5IDW9_9EURO|nr:hypothetical protein BP00DRAFT_422808 [Aspergillus indologenus CBS 114.80]